MKLFRRRFKPKHPLFSRQLADVLRRQEISHVLDVGANTGQFGQELYWAGFPGTMVSFEPQPGVHAVLGDLARRTAGWTVAPPMGLGAATGTLELLTYNRTDMSSFMPVTATTGAAMPSLAPTGAVEVPVSRLDDIARSYIPDGARTLLKIDVQGFEGEVLAGAEQTLPRLAGVLVELGTARLYANQPSYLEILTLLERKGFRFWLLSHGYYSKAVGRQLDFDALLLNETMVRETA